MNTLYLNTGVTKEQIVDTKAAISLPMHFVKLGTYATLGAMSGKLSLIGIAAGLLAGAVTIWEQRAVLAKFLS